MSFTQLDSPVFVYSLQPDGPEVASQLIALLSISTMSILFGIKTYNVQYRYLSYSKWLVILLYTCSWAFTISALILMATNNGNYLSCLLSELACDVFYSGTKILIYCWLIEKIWVVKASRTSRWQTRSYRIHVLLLTPYIAIFSLMVVFHNAWLESDGKCQIGLQPIATIPLITYDFLINMYMTIQFVLPLMKVGNDTNLDWRQSRLHEVAKKTMIASVVCLIASFANITTLAIMGGVERGLVCLTCCAVDVMINVITVHWVTSQPSGKPTRDTLISGSKPDTQHYETSDTIMQCLPTISHNSPEELGSSQANSTPVPTDKKKRFRFEPSNEQYGQFGNHAWSAPDYQSQPEEYNATHYMSATNNQIYKSPAAPDYHTPLPAYQSSNVPPSGRVPNHFMNGRFVMVTADERDFHASSTSPSSSLHESSSHSSKTSLTNIPTTNL